MGVEQSGYSQQDGHIAQHPFAQHPASRQDAQHAGHLSQQAAFVQHEALAAADLAELSAIVAPESATRANAETMRFTNMDFIGNSSFNGGLTRHLIRSDAHSTPGQSAGSASDRSAAPDSSVRRNEWSSEGSEGRRSRRAADLGRSIGRRQIVLARNRLKRRDFNCGNDQSR